ncbi:hypothetical protein HMSSN139_66090 [Paenibacillus sp. HMSSN-139]|nr:hypothetical protein HMSSN139_66090 [Paenibacillus sp. HMSSN-139]
MRNIMMVAWKIAKKAAVKFGGSPVEYLSESLKQAWKVCGKQVKRSSKIATLTIAAGSRNHKSWVAKIDGVDAKYGLKRTFIDSADHNLSERTYKLSAGVYEVCSAGERYFIRVVGGKINKVAHENIEKAVS